MQKTQKQGSFEGIKSLLIVSILALSIRILIMEPFFVPTGSMFPTILENEYIFSTKYSYGYSRYSLPFYLNIFEGRFFNTPPKRGDIIIFTIPNNPTRYIKRLIGLPGEKIQIINDIIYINGQPVKRQIDGKYTDEKGKVYDRYIETLPNEKKYSILQIHENTENLLNKNYSNTEIFDIPEGKYFFLGDNRDNSSDSRASLGLVPEENLIAKAQFIYLSTKELLFAPNLSFIDHIKQIPIWIFSIRWNRIFMIISK